MPDVLRPYRELRPFELQSWYLSSVHARWNFNANVVDRLEVRSALRLLAHGVVAGSDLWPDPCARNATVTARTLGAIDALPLAPMAQTVLAEHMSDLRPGIAFRDLPNPDVLGYLGAAFDLLEGARRGRTVTRVLRSFASWMQFQDPSGRFRATVDTACRGQRARNILPGPARVSGIDRSGLRRHASPGACAA